MEEDNVVVSFCIIIIASFMMSIRQDIVGLGHGHDPGFADADLTNNI